MHPPSARFAMFHGGPHGCGQAAFYMVEKPVPGDLILASNIRVLEGMVEPAALSPIVCGSCNRCMGPENLQTGYIAEVQ